MYMYIVYVFKCMVFLHIFTIHHLLPEFWSHLLSKSLEDMAFQVFSFLFGRLFPNEKCENPDVRGKKYGARLGGLCSSMFNIESRYLLYGNDNCIHLYYQLVRTIKLYHHMVITSR